MNKRLDEYFPTVIEPIKQQQKKGQTIGLPFDCHKAKNYQPDSRSGVAVIL